MKHLINKVTRFAYHRALGLFIIRAAAGAIFLVHGWEKLNNLPMVSGFFMLISGFATRVAGVVLGIDMLFAIFLTGVGRGFHAHEFEMLLMAVSFGIALIGSGAYSLLKMECTKCGGMLCNGDCN
jgi:uncharacterized membrane protein YphA (DoxX/SURF4 family)